MSDIKVGDKVYLNPEGEYACDDEYQLPVGQEGLVTNKGGAGFHVEWTTVAGRCLVNYYSYHDLIKVVKLEEDETLPVHKAGQNVSPKEVDGEILTGCGVIISVEESKYNVVYEVLTDFGHVVTLTASEIEKHYKTYGGCVDIEGRIQIQMDKLTNVWLKLKEGDYNEQ